ncbi:peptidoglycan DD-metalloendopeptidase family protein [Corynebacterium uropygiale]|uniref:Peptidoglycan DD-metalloendopeptidase family protein n=1 Tax=Corynebacterium uropygiale TaxID=1775911 RepID=A0A9X1TYR7_9CORY|nr:peptidoglycan DD-metalloendopeptidase family protein [Corynebacterium uropygiale]
MKKLLAGVLSLVLLLVLFVVMLGAEDEDDCAPGSSSSGGGVAVNGDYAYPTDKNATQVSSPFGWRDIGSGQEFHNGIDLAGPKGTPIYAFADGTVVAAQDQGVQGFGGWVVLDHNFDGKKYQTVYGHIEPGHVHVKVGDTVKAGDRIADMGTAGRSTGDHLHFEVVEGDRAAGGQQIDPAPWLEKAENGTPTGETGKDNDKDSGDDNDDNKEAKAKESNKDTSAGMDNAGVVEGVEGLTPRQSALAKQIVAVGELKGMDREAIIIALATAKHESQLKNLAATGEAAGESAGASPATAAEIAESMNYPHDDVVHGDNASVGTFQQQIGFWGTAKELMNPAHQASQFYDKLKTIDYHNMTIGQAAHTIQVNDTGEGVYDAEAGIAERLYEHFKGAGSQMTPEEIEALGISGTVESSGKVCHGGNRRGGTPLPNGPIAEKIIAAAKEQFGLPYVWGGGNYDGPTNGGFDCSGLVLYSVAQATDGKIQLCHNTNCQKDDSRLETVSWEDRQPGDLLYFGTPGGDYHHTSIYVGDKDGTPYHYEAQDFGVPVGEFPVPLGEDIQVRRVPHTDSDKNPAEEAKKLTQKAEDK